MTLGIEKEWRWVEFYHILGLNVMNTYIIFQGNSSVTFARCHLSPVPGCRLRGGAGGWQGRQRMAEAPGGLIGSPSVSGTEQMSEWKDRSPFASKFTFSSLCVCVCVRCCQCVYGCVIVVLCGPYSVRVSDVSHSGWHRSHWGRLSSIWSELTEIRSSS